MTHVGTVAAALLDDLARQRQEAAHARTVDAIARAVAIHQQTWALWERVRADQARWEGRA